MRTRLYKAPDTEPLEVADVAYHRRVTLVDPSDTTDPEVKLLQGLIRSARIRAEDFTARKLISQTWEYFLDWGFPPTIELPFLPVASVTSVYSIAPDGVKTRLDSNGYVLDANTVPARIDPPGGKRWPATQCARNAVVVRFVAGYGAAGDTVPAPILSAMRLMVGDAYEFREGTIVGRANFIPSDAESLLWPYKWTL